MTQPGEDLHELDSPRLDHSRAAEAPEADACGRMILTLGRASAGGSVGSADRT